MIGYLVSINPYFLIFGVPIFVIGIVLVFLSKKKLYVKILTLVIPPLLYIPGFWALIYFGSEHQTPVTYYIPSEYRGEVAIVFDEDCGQNPEFVDERRLYDIPEDGVLITQFIKESGILDHEYYLIDSAGNKTSIPFLDSRDFKESWNYADSTKEPSRDLVGVFLQGTSFYHSADLEYSSQNIFVGSYNDRDMHDFKRDIAFDSTAEHKLINCRSGINQN